MENIAGNLFLIGLMGAGKTTVGRQLAQRLGRSFYDSDQVIVARTGVSIATIFELEGEAGFRERERGVIEELTALPDIVLATGGGAVLDPDNRRCLTERGTVIYLRVTVAAILQRTRYDKTRPLLQVDNPAEKLAELYRQRDPIYQEMADMVVGSDGLSAHCALQDILTQLKRPSLRNA